MDYKEIDGDGSYTTYNRGLFYSDGIKINDSQIAIILTNSNLYQFVICIINFFFEQMSFIMRYYELNFDPENFKTGENLRAFTFRNCLGMVFFNQENGLPGYTIFDYPSITEEENEDDVYKVAVEVDFSYKSLYEFIALLRHISPS